MKSRSSKLWILLPILALLIMPLARGLWYYRGLPEARQVPAPDLSGVSVPTPRTGIYVDQPEPGEGLILFDRGHDNDYSPAEIGPLSAALANRGLLLAEYDGADDLALALRPALAFVVITPFADFSAQEVAAVRDFVDKGGRLLLIGDPTRYVLDWDEYYEYYDIVTSARLLNALAEPFGLTFEEDYLYNVVEHEGNYQNILFEQFAAENPLTAGLSQVAFYSTHSIRSYGGGLIIAEGETRSSTNELGRELAAAAMGGEEQVLAIGDLSFMTSPYANAFDNDRLIANLADFMGGGERLYELADFPHYLGDEVELVPLGLEENPLGSAHVLVVSRLEQILRANERELSIGRGLTSTQDLLFVGLFGAAEGAETYLEEGGITVAPVQEALSPSRSLTLTIAGIGEVDSAGLGLLYRQQEGEQQVLVLLADEVENLGLMLDNLSRGDLSACVTLHEDLVLCALGEGGSWDGNGDENGDGDGEGGNGGPSAGSLLIVDDNDAEWDCYTGADFVYYYALYEDYEVDEWYEYTEGEPSLDDLLPYDAVIWATGTCSGTAPSESDAETLLEYVDHGGRLLIGGMRVGSDWAGSDFYAGVCHAEFLDVAPQIDLQVSDGEHPITEGLEAGQVIEFDEFYAEYEMHPDVIAPLEGADVVFVRGPNSEQAGAASVLAYEGEAGRVVYMAFPSFFVLGEEMDLLIQNAVSWLLEE
ncbi:MAG: ThuA domain-containing protein [Chloroflexia bacterium]|nr:ThuA domain-containing protein [Chloroflexia bacterium]